MSQVVTPALKKEIFGHPAGLFVLFFTEMWERFSFYGMRGILTLYIAASASAIDPGLGWNTKDAIALYAWYTMLVYVSAIPGGWLADRFWGQKKAVLIGGVLLCIGHGILAVPQDWAFFSGIIFIIMGVGCLKPNISTMVGGLYPEGDIRRDNGFTIFYIGINIGSFLAAISVGLVAYYYGWHYGFGLAGIGMGIGLIIYLLGQKHLDGVGEFSKGAKATEAEREAAQRPLNKVEKDRLLVLLIACLIIIVFWGAFEQAGGMMNLYTDIKVDRYLGLTWLEEIPAATFQSLNAMYIIIFGTLIGGFWTWWQKKGRESSAIFKMAIGTIIMGAGFIFMMFASKEAASAPFGKAAIFWILLTYLAHTIGELCTSPVALSFITKMAPLKYASIMMGIYFAASGFGNFLAGKIGQASQLSPYQGEAVAQKEDFIPLMRKVELKEKDEKGELKEFRDYPINHGKSFMIKALLFVKDEQVDIVDYLSNQSLNKLFVLREGQEEQLKDYLKSQHATEGHPRHARLHFEKDKESLKDPVRVGDGRNYTVNFVIEEQQNRQEYRTFFGLVIFTACFGILILLFLKRLKKLTHGAEDKTLANKEE